MNKSHLTIEQLEQNTESLFSANTAVFLGLQQYWTPPKLAEWLKDVAEGLIGNLNTVLACDLTAGAGNLIAPYPQRVGVEVDKTVIEAKGIKNADLVSLYPYLRQELFQATVMALNPPYGEKWQRSVFMDDEQAATIESQIATIYAAQTLLEYNGFGYAVISSKILPKVREMRGIIAQMSLGEDLFAPHAKVPVSVVWFVSTPHWKYQVNELQDVGEYSLETLPEAGMVAKQLETCGIRRNNYRDVERPQAAFDRAYKMYKLDQKKNAWTYNVYVQGKTLHVVFNNLQRNILNERPRHTPLSYYVFNPDALNTLYNTIDYWNRRLPKSHQVIIEPELETALAKEQMRSDRQMTPYYPLKVFQRMGWLHTLKQIRCIKDFPEYGFLAGKDYPIETQVMNKTEVSSKDNEASTTRIEVKSKYLLIKIGEEEILELTEDDGGQAIISEYFEMPDVFDVAEKYPEEYEENVERVLELQNRYQFKEYQVDMLARLLTKKDGNLRSLLSAEQGMGKTRMTLALIELLWMPKSLIVTKKKIFDHWVKEAKTVGFPVPIQKIQKASEARKAAQAESGVFVTTYPILYTVQTKGKKQKACIRLTEECGHQRQYFGKRPVWFELGKTTHANGKEYTPETVYGNAIQEMYVKRYKGAYNLLKQGFRSGMIVLDEPTIAKKKQNAVAKAVYALQAKHRLGLSGEPIDNYLNDIYWVCIWLFGENNPLFPYDRKSATNFVNDYLKTEHRTITFEKDGHDKKCPVKILPEISNVSLLWKLISPLFIVRRWSDLDADDMVGLNVRVWDMPFATEQLHVYQAWQEKLDKFIAFASGKDLGAGFVNIIGGYHSKLRLAACLPSATSLDFDVGKDDDGERRLFPGGRADSPFTPKVEQVVTLAMNYVQAKKQCVIFCLYKEEVAFYTDLFQQYGIAVEKVTGETSATKFAKINEAFQAGEVQIVVASILACAEGISWFWVSHGIFTTVTWRHSKLRQAMHRLRRINSVDDVTIDLVLTRESIDWRAYNLQVRKGRSSDMCLQGEIKQEYEGKDARALMYEALEEVTASDQESMAVIEQRVRMLLGSYQQKCPVLITPKPEVRPIPVFNGIPLEFGKVPVELVIQQRKPKVAVNQLSLFG